MRAAQAEVDRELATNLPESRAWEYAETRRRNEEAAFAEGRGPDETERLKAEQLERLRATGLYEEDEL